MDSVLSEYEYARRVIRLETPFMLLWKKWHGPILASTLQKLLNTRSKLHSASITPLPFLFPRGPPLLFPISLLTVSAVTGQQQTLPVDRGGERGQCVHVSVVAGLAVQLQGPTEHLLQHLRVGAQVPGLLRQQLHSCKQWTGSNADNSHSNIKRNAFKPCTTWFSSF